MKGGERSTGALSADRKNAEKRTCTHHEVRQRVNGVRRTGSWKKEMLSMDFEEALTPCEHVRDGWKSVLTGNAIRKKEGRRPTVSEGRREASQKRVSTRRLIRGVASREH